MELQLKSEVKTITPEAAEKIWKHSNPGNRRVRKGHVKTLARAMEKGEFKNTGQGLIFDTKGKLLDGQHRLLACIEADTPIEILVTEGVDRENFRYIDRGATRSVRDDLDFAGYKYAELASRIAPFIDKWFNDYDGPQGQNMETVHKRDRKMNLLDMIEEYAQEDIMERILALPSRTNIESMAKRSLFDTLAYILLDCDLSEDKKYATYFLERLLTGEMLHEGSPILVLRNRLIHHRNQSRLPKAEKLSNTCLFVYGFKAWNAFIQGREMKVLRYGANDAMVWPLEAKEDALPDFTA